MFGQFFWFRGRVGRQQMWFAGFLYAAAMATSMLAAIQLKRLVIWLGFAAPILVAALIAISAISLIVRRLHDRDKDWWWALLYVGLPILLNSALFPYNGTPTEYLAIGISAILLLVWFVEAYFMRGTKGENRFGPDPVQYGVVHPLTQDA